MIKTVFGFSVFLWFSFMANGQINGNIPVSKHMADLEAHGASINRNATINTRANIIPLDISAKTTPTAVVFGYLPYWKYPYALDYLQYDLLTHIAAFDFQVSQNGDIDYPPSWPWTDLINESHENGVRVIVTAVNFSGSQIHTILTDNGVKENFFNNTLSILQQFGLDGVNIDFESISYSDRGAVLNNFMDELTYHLHEADSTYEISFAGPPVNWGGWDFEGLAASCDYIFIMGYNFWGSWSNTSGPCAPLIGGSINMTNVVLDDYGAVTENNPEKLILGVPYYGNKWKTQNEWAYSDVLDHLSQPTFLVAMNQAEQDTLLWDNLSQTSWSLNSNYGQYRQTWFDTDSSLGLKYDLAQNHMLKGVGMWALGYDGQRPELWDELRKHFGEPIFIANNELRDDNDNINIFPNPFQGTTTIEITVKNPVDISINVFDNRGRIVSVVTDNNGFNEGKHRFELDMGNCKPGLYYCRVSYKSYNKQSVSSKSLMLLH